jgi:hypothetical protein
MKLTPIHTVCKPVVCPTLYWTDRGTVVVQGFDVTDAEGAPEPPSGESWVEVPISLLREGLPRISERLP